MYAVHHTYPIRLSRELNEITNIKHLVLMNELYYSGSIFIIILVITEELKCFIKMVTSYKPRIVCFAFAIDCL